MKTKSLVEFISLACSLSGLVLLLAAPAAAAEECVTVTFEGMGTAVMPETPLPGTEPIGIRFTGRWFSLTSPPGAFTNAPSPTTVATWSGSVTGVVEFDAAVEQVSLFYASQLPVTIDAFDANGALVDSVAGAANNSTTPFGNWFLLSVAGTGNEITRIVVGGQALGTIIDNLDACQAPTDPVELLAALIMEVDDINYVQGIDNALDRKLDAAWSALIDANDFNDVAACNALDAFVHFVDVQHANGKLTEEQATFLTDSVLEILALLCGL